MFRKYLLIITLLELLKLINSSPTQQELSIIEEVSQGFQPIIINGFQASKGQFPWQVAIYLQLGFKGGFCGGSLIGDQWILTAAHCTPATINVFDSLQCMVRATLTFNLKVDCFKPKFVVLLGSLNAIKPDLGAWAVEADYAVSHPRFTTINFNNDIAVIKLKSKVTFSDVIKPINLSANSNYLGSNVRVLVSGWGLTKDANTQISELLNYVNLTTITNNQCNKYYGLISDNIVCTVSSTGEKQSTCSGDSGGPLVIFDANRKPIHVGIVSFGSNKGCEKGYPTGYTRTSRYRDWIRKETGI